ncbi:MAG: flavodoxin family protein [Oscillospiraceae bacterium]
MKVLVLNGSPKGERSNTLNITKAFLDGFPSGTDVEFATLYQMDIKPCRGCFSCWGKAKGKCVIQDDMQQLYEKILAADIIIESFPLFFFGMPSQMKCMTDRCLAFMMPYMGNVVEDGRASFHEMRDKTLFEKKLVIISSCGYVDDKPMYPALKMQLDSICGEGCYTGIFCPQGELFVSPMAKRQREGYLSDIRQAGAEFAEKLSLSEETKKRISKPILSPNGFATITSTHWKQKAE